MNILRFILVNIMLGVLLGVSCENVSKRDQGEEIDSLAYMEDESKLFQSWIDSAQVGDTVYLPEGTHYVRTMRLRSGINIVSKGLLRQLPPKEPQEYSMEQQNSVYPLFRGSKIRDISLRFHAETRQEAIYLDNSQQVKISHVKASGDSTKYRSFSGMLFFNCDSISIDNTEIAYYGAPRRETHRYQPGTGMRFLSSRVISIENSLVHHNGENGLFFHDCTDVAVSHNQVEYNGMSGIQIAFGSAGREKNFLIAHNRFDHNAADAVDINQPDPKHRLAIFADIEHNIANDNGFVRGESTPDGSGIATLVGVSHVNLLNNRSSNNNRPSIYLQNCDTIYASNNETDNVLEMVGENGAIVLEKSKFGGIRLLKNASAKKLSVQACAINHLSFSNDIKIDSLSLIDSDLKGNINIHMNGFFLLKGNTLYSPSPSGAITLAKADGAVLTKNKIQSSAAPGIRIEKEAKQVFIGDNTIRSVEACIYDRGAGGLRIMENNFVPLPLKGKIPRTVWSVNPNNLVLDGNVHESGQGAQSVWFEGGGKAFVKNETYNGPPPRFGETEIIN